MNKFPTHQTNGLLTSNRTQLTDEHLLSTEDQRFLKSLAVGLDCLIRDPSEDLLCAILTYSELL